MRYYLILKTELYDEDSEKYNKEYIKDINSLGRVINLNPKTARQSLDGTMFITETHNLENNIDKSKIGQSIEKAFSFSTTDESYTERALVEEKLEELKLDNEIVAYGHYPHMNDGRQACIHCYLKEHQSEWEKQEE